MPTTKTAKVATKTTIKSRAKTTTLPKTKKSSAAILAALASRVELLHPDHWAARITVYLMDAADLREYRGLDNFIPTNSERASFVVDSYCVTEIGALRPTSNVGSTLRLVEVTVAEKRVNYQLGTPVALKNTPTVIAGLFSRHEDGSVVIAVRAFMNNGELEPFPGDDKIEERFYDPAEVVLYKKKAADVRRS